MRLEVLSIGNELLTGDVLDRNAAYLGQIAQRFGVTVSARQTIPDDEDAIVDALRAAAARADLVVVSGGLGPTSDDRTMEAAAVFTGQALRRDEEVLSHIKARFARAERTFTENNASQADIPETGRALANPIGTAPGVALVHDDTTLLFFPGVHREYIRFVDDEVVPLLRDHVGVSVRWRTVRTFGWTESAVAEALEVVVLEEGEWLQYRATFPEILVTAVVRGGQEEDIEARLEERCAQIRSVLGSIVYGEGEQTFPEAVGEVLRQAGYQIAIAESCTGGLIGHLITSASGSSDYFREGLIAYSNDIKVASLGVSEETLKAHGAVSVETVQEMVQGLCARTGADVGIAVSGIAGPTGGTKEKPVGTVCWAVQTPGKPPVGRSSIFRGNRDQVKTLAAWAALESVRRACLSEEVVGG